MLRAIKRYREGVWRDDTGCARRARSRGLLPRDFLKGVRRADRRLQRGRPGAVRARPGTVRRRAAAAIDARQLDSWIAIAADGSVTAYTGKCELGQGMSTAQTQLVAEELSVPFDRVKLIQCDTALTPDQGTTSGSQSHPTNFNDGNLAQAGATAREALLAAGRRRGWPCRRPARRSTDGVVSAKSDPRSESAYGELIGGRKFNLPLNANAKRKPPSEWTVLGTAGPARRHAGAGHGAVRVRPQRARARHAARRVVRPPAVGATLVSVDESSVRTCPAS